MKKVVEQSDDASVTARLKQAMGNISNLITNGSEEQKRTILEVLENHRLLELLEDWRHGERRKTDRKPFSLSVQYATEHEILTDFPRDISSGGMFIETSASLPVGQQITLTLTPPNEGKTIKAAAEVVWTGPGGVGVRFTAMSKELERMIKKL
ncbi:MAG: PilZ domain-containing protein [Thermodesulfobacteriota bacterium]|nr:PilZ domain-containing protein [Thermodesulfobacteriota bacterium]